MNKTEAIFAREILDPLLREGEALAWFFEPGGLRLAKRTVYHPDFLLIRPDGLTYIEVKGGHVEDDAAVKFKAAAEMHFYAVFKMAFVTVKRGTISNIKWTEYTR